MREIKFRVWDPVQHKMLKPSYLEFIDGNAYWVEAGEDDSQNDGPIDSPVTRPVVKVGVLLEQYTGLKDYYGTPIYEGDILKVTADDMNSYMAPVVWYGDDGYPAFDLDGRYIPKEWDYAANRLSTIIDTGEHVIGVGNVHQDSELLEDE